MRMLYLLLFILTFQENLLHAEDVHRDPSVLPAVDHAVEDLQVIREDGFLYTKDLVRDGFRVKVSKKNFSTLTKNFTFNQFVDKKSCNDNKEGLILVAYTLDNLDKAQTSCAEQLEGTVISKDTEGRTFLCKYPCDKITLEALQGLFFEKFVRYIEPNVQRSLN